MHPSVQKYLEAASGLGTLTAARAEQLVKQLIRSGEAAGDQMSELVDGLMERQRQNRDAITALVRKEAARAVNAMGLATTEEVERLEQTITGLEQDVAELRAKLATPTPTSSAATPGARRGTGSTATRKTAAKTAAKTSAKKTAAKVSAKKTTAKTSAKKATATKATAKKATATKATAKKTPASTTAGKKTAAKKTAAKKTSATTTARASDATSARIAARDTGSGTDA